MRAIKIFLLPILLLFACTEKSDVYKQMAVVDSMLNKNLTDSAYAVLSVLNPINKEDSAYYNILDFQIRYRQNKHIKSVEPVNYSIEYYTQNNDKEKLATAYLCKVCYFFRKTSMQDEMIILLKTAEKLVENTNNYNLQNKIYNALAITNAIESLHSEAIRYAKKEYQTALKSTNTRNIAYALVDLSIMYRELNNIDSSNYYLSGCKKLIKNVNNNDKAFIYNLLGEYFLDYNTESAEEYFLSALKYNKLSDTYFNLGKLYKTQNNISKSEIYYDSSLMYAPDIQKINIYSLKIKNACADNRLSETVGLTDSIIAIQKKVFKAISENKTLEMQKKFDFEHQKNEFEKKIIMLWFSLGIAAVIIVLIIIWNRLRVLEHKKYEDDLENSNRELQDNSAYLDEKITFYREQISNLENINDEQSTQLVSMKKTLAKMEKQSFENYETGRKIFEKIVNTEPILNDAKLWGHCINYYILKNPDFIQTLKSYNDLLISEKIFILIDIVKESDNYLMSKILGISVGTIRSRRSKIKKKQPD